MPIQELSEADFDFIMANTAYNDKEQLREQGGTKRPQQSHQTLRCKQSSKIPYTYHCQNFR